MQEKTITHQQAFLEATRRLGLWWWWGSSWAAQLVEGIGGGETEELVMGYS